VAIARALVTDPALVLADEPTPTWTRHGAKDTRSDAEHERAPQGDVLLLDHDEKLMPGGAHRAHLDGCDVS